MTNEEMRAGLEKAFELLAYALPNNELVDPTQWEEDCEKWLDKFAPSKVKAAVEPGVSLVTCDCAAQRFEGVHAKDCPKHPNRDG